MKKSRFTDEQVKPGRFSHKLIRTEVVPFAVDHNERAVTSFILLTSIGREADIHRSACRFSNVSPDTFSGLGYGRAALLAGILNFRIQLNLRAMEWRGLEPLTPCLQSSDTRSEVVKKQDVSDTSANACTSACTSDPKNAHDDTAGDDFGEALAMIARLPLSDAEKAEAVRRLLAQADG